MLKKLTYIITGMFLFILYGQEMFDMGHVVHDAKCICINVCEYIETPREDFYFIGMSIVISLFAFFLYKADKNVATGFLLFLCMGEIFNQIFFAHDLGRIEIAFGVVGFLYVLLEPKIKVVFKRWKK